VYDNPISLLKGMFAVLVFAIYKFTLKDDKQYGISFDLGRPDDLQLIQQMIDSFRITVR
jgi:hypothetical protein